MSNIGKLVGGFKVFKSTTFPQKQDVIRHLVEQGHKPTTMVISCSDLRLAPAEIFATNPGDLYLVSNIGGIVPKHDTKGISGVLAAIEYAVTTLEVENIVVLAHAHCDSIKMIMSEKTSTGKGLSEPMKAWLAVAAEARDAVKKEMSGKSEEEQQAACERESLVVSLSNLMEYPYVAKRMKEQKLNVFGWHFNIETGEIASFDMNTNFFEPIV